MGWPSKLTDQKPVAQKLPKELSSRIDGLLKRYPNKRAALIPAFHKCQEHFGYVSDGTIHGLADYLGLAPSYIADTMSFYAMLSPKPLGNYHIEICQTISCALLGADSLADYLTEKLGIGFGEVTPDGKFSLQKVECIGACEQAPAMLINNELYGNLTAVRIDEIMEGLT